MSTSRFFIVAGIVAGVCALIGFVVFTVITYRSAYTLQANQLGRTYTSLSAGAMLYGTIVSVDQAGGTLTVRTKNNYDSNGSDIVYQLPVTTDAFIGRQDMLSVNGLYGAVSSTTPASAGNLLVLTPGMHIKFFILNQSSGSAISYLLYGNPL